MLVNVAAALFIGIVLLSAFGSFANGVRASIRGGQTFTALHAMAVVLIMLVPMAVGGIAAGLLPNPKQQGFVIFIAIYSGMGTAALLFRGK